MSERFLLSIPVIMDGRHGDSRITLRREGSSYELVIWREELPGLIDAANVLLRELGDMHKTVTKTGTSKSFFAGGPEV